MKIIATSSFKIKNDVLISENLGISDGHRIVDFLNTESGGTSSYSYYYKLVDDDYELYRSQL